MVKSYRSIFIFTATLLLLNPFLDACSKNKSSIKETKSGVETNSVIIEAEWLSLSYKALLDFQSKQPNLRCFTVYIGPEGKQLEVSFMPKGAIHKRNGKIYEVEQGGSTEECGQGVTYILDLEGNIIKKFYMK